MTRYRVTSAWHRPWRHIVNNAGAFISLGLRENPPLSTGVIQEFSFHNIFIITFYIIQFNVRLLKFKHHQIGRRVNGVVWQIMVWQSVRTMIECHFNFFPFWKIHDAILLSIFAKRLSYANITVCSHPQELIFWWGPIQNYLRLYTFLWIFVIRDVILSVQKLKEVM